MVRKLKAPPQQGDSKLAQTVRDSAQQIWLAGLGAFSKAQAEGSKMFDALVKEGQDIHAKTRKAAEAKVDEITSTLGKMATKASNQAGGNWDKLDQAFEERVARALNRVAVPTNKEIQNLAKRVEKLTANVQRPTGARKETRRRKPAKRSSARENRRRRAVLKRGGQRQAPCRAAGAAPLAVRTARLAGVPS